jgi:hypothetical protein
MKIVGIVLVVIGILALAYQGFSYQKPEQVAKIGSLEVTAQKTEFVWVSPVVSVAILLAGVGLIVLPRRMA